jgi:nucleoside-diphosphate-sugar epimerase
LKPSKEIFLTGNTGFIGKYVVDFFNDCAFTTFSRHSDLNINQEVVIHLAGIANDIKKTSNPEDYYKTNTELSQKIFDAFLDSRASVFITLSSVKAVADEVFGALTEETTPSPMTHYGRSKLLAEKYILSKVIPNGKRVYILRPSMIHGPGNKGNLNLLFKLVSKGIPWPLGAFENKRSFCSIDNVMFIFKELIEREDIPSGVYNIADDEPLSSNEVISLMALSQNRIPKILDVPKQLIQFVSKLGNYINLGFNEERLQKLSGSYVVSNKKLISVIGKPLPVSSREGLLKTFRSFQ